MITKAQALTATEFHADNCTKHVGPRGGTTIHCEVWRRNGKTQTWVTRPNEFRIPVKHGLYAYGAISHTTAPYFHTAEDCPLHQQENDARRSEGLPSVGDWTDAEASR